MDKAAAAVRRARLEPADRLRPDRHHLQHLRRGQAGARRPDRGQALQRPDHHVERPGDQGAQRGRRRCPPTAINVVFRSDQSGTTDNFQHYLDAASKGAWGKGAGKTFNGGVGEGAQGNEGTSAAINRTPGSITYNEWSFAKAQNLHMAQILTVPPEPVDLTVDSASKAIAGVKVKGEGNDLVLDTSSFYNPTDAARTRSCWAPTRSSARSTATPTRQGRQGVPDLGGRQRSGGSGRGRVHPAAGLVQDQADHRHQRDLLINAIP